MRTREEIFNDVNLANKWARGWNYAYRKSERNEAFQRLALEVLLDIRDLLSPIKIIIEELEKEDYSGKNDA